MALTEEQLLKKKKEIETAKQELSELKGESNALLKRLKEEWQCNDLPAAKKKIEKYKKEIEDLDIEITEKTRLLEKTYFQE